MAEFKESINLRIIQAATHIVDVKWAVISVVDLLYT